MDLRNLEQVSNVETLIPREMNVNLKYTSPDGVVHECTLVSKIPDGDERMLIDRRTASLAGVSWNTLSEYARARCEGLALISVQVRNIPDWLNEWVTQDDDLLFNVKGVCERHSLVYFRSNRTESEGEEATPRIQVHAGDFTELLDF
mgnify:CR=1 FL=1|jgi:hypothetical protein